MGLLMSTSIKSESLLCTLGTSSVFAVDGKHMKNNAHLLRIMILIVPLVGTYGTLPPKGLVDISKLVCDLPTSGVICVGNIIKDRIRLS